MSPNYIGTYRVETISDQACADPLEGNEQKMICCCWKPPPAASIPHLKRAALMCWTFSSRKVML